MPLTPGPCVAAFGLKARVCLSSSSEILKHQDLDGKIKTACLGSLLLQEHLDRLENQYLAHKEVKTTKQEWGQLGVGKLNPLFLCLGLGQHII